MEDMTYNVAWADDEIDSMFDERQKELFDIHHIHLVAACQNAADLSQFLENKNCRVDAVVVDANFTIKAKSPSNEEHSGLDKSLRLSEKYSEIPFFIYTGRPDLLSRMNNGELDGLAIFNKPDIIPLLEKIKAVVDRVNSTEFHIDNQYKKELSYCQIFDKQCNASSYELVRSLLIRSRDGNLESAEQYFNQFRSEVLENMNAVAAHFGIVPKGLSLNNFSRFLCHSNIEDYGYALKEDVLPKALYRLMQFVVMTIQDGSHNRGNLQYEVRQYVSINKDSMLIRSLLFAVIELLSWFIPYLANHADYRENMEKWQQ